MKNTLAIIPARGGSKRIPGKNIKDFFGKPVIAYAIEAARESGLFTKIIVSTDNEEIAGVAVKYGAEVPFLRSAENSDDNATTKDVLKEVISSFEARNEHYQFACCIYPANPFLTPVLITDAYKKLIGNNMDSVFTAIRFNDPVHRSFVIDKDKIKLLFPEYKNTRSQDLPVVFHDAGQFYWFDVQKFKIQNELWTMNTGVVEVNEEIAQDIDTLKDWEMAELKYKRWKESGQK
jgi:pseudaminic acid cytidylyltransferase